MGSAQSARAGENKCDKLLETSPRPQTAHSDAAQTAPIHDAFKRNEAVISAPTAAAVA